MNLKGKKLLVLGSTPQTIDIINYAKNLGVYTIVTDWNDPTKAPVKLAADEHWEVSLLDYDELTKRIRENGINGIITGFTDSYLLPYQQLCELTGLPCYATKEVFEVTLDKSKFKQLCIENDVPTVPAYNLEDFDPSVISPDFKIIIKPVDNSGSRGIKVCSNSEDFQSCLDYALSFSQKKEVVIERFIEMDNVALCYVIQDGEVTLSSMNDRFVHIGETASACTSASIYPSKYLDFYIQNIDEKVRRMYERLGAKNGVLSLGAFTNGSEFYFYEMGYRLTGGRHYIYTNYENGTNAVEYLINFAITGNMSDDRISVKENPFFHDYCCKLYILGKSAQIARVDGLDYLEKIPECIKTTLYRNVGDTIGVDGTTAQQIAMVNLIVKDWNRFLEIQKDIREHFKVFDAEGNDLIIDFMK